jgi:glycosyltransferase involved in cell wall biosynthesis
MDINDFVRQLNSVISEPVATEVVNAVPPREETPSIMTTTASTASTTVDPPLERVIKLLIVSTHINQINGYSKVIYNIIQQLSVLPWLKITHFGSQKIITGDIGRKYPQNIKLIDASALEKQKQHGFSFTELPGIINTEKPDVVFIYGDIPIVCSYIEEIRKVIENRFFRIWTYVDMIYRAVPQQMIDSLNRDAERIFCFTKSWKEQLKIQGITRPVDIMNHGIDTKLVRKIPRDLARQSLGLPKDTFLFASMNRNIPRKRLDLVIISFVKLIVKFPMKPIFMLVVADKGDKGGYQLFDIFARELKLAGVSVDAFGNRLLLTSSNTCYKDDDINMLYNCANVGISCSESEGFGLCSFEQMYLEIPQIVPSINGYTEYCTEENSILVKPRMRYYLPHAYNIVTGEAHIVDPDDVAKAMERYVFNEDLCKLHGKLGKETVIQYTWEKACAILIRRLKALQEDDD